MLYASFIVFEALTISVEFFFQNLLRETGCLEKLTSLLGVYDMAVKTNRTVPPRLVNGVITSINNLAVNEQNQQHLQVCFSCTIFTHR